MSYENRILSGNFLVYDEDGFEREVYIKRVVYNKPATIVFWSDDTKTTTVCHEKDNYSADSGLMFCIVKKLAGRKHYSNLLTNWMPSDVKHTINEMVTLQEVRKKELKNKK